MTKETWSGAQDPLYPDDQWIDDETDERVCAHTGKRLPPYPKEIAEAAWSAWNSDDEAELLRIRDALPVALKRNGAEPPRA